MASTTTALRVNQWLPEWSDLPFNHLERRSEPQPYFFVLTMKAAMLKRLTGVHRRKVQSGMPRAEEVATQRQHQTGRSDEIARFVKYGYPYSRLDAASRERGEDDALKNPGWLPTSVLINVLRTGDDRDGRAVHPDDVVLIEDDGSSATATVRCPDVGAEWTPTDDGVHPLEVIDGQHRLWAFEDSGVDDDFELPVVAFVGLDRAWQAYLFWTINVTPTRINASLAYDLYPLLRRDDQVFARFSGAPFYRDNRAQELVEALWVHPLSPWRDRINMLGETGVSGVRQAAWIRALTNTFVRSFDGRRVKVGGLFGARSGEHVEVIPWTRAQQSAFLIAFWRDLQDRIDRDPPPWAITLLAQGEYGSAMWAPNCLLNTDQGVRGSLAVLNDLTVTRLAELSITEWRVEDPVDGDRVSDISGALTSLESIGDLTDHVEKVAVALATFDWRGAKAPGLSTEEEMLRLTFRGSSGYLQVRRALLRHVATVEPTLAPATGSVLSIIADEGDKE